MTHPFFFCDFFLSRTPVFFQDFCFCFTDPYLSTNSFFVIVFSCFGYILFMSFFFNMHTHVVGPFVCLVGAFLQFRQLYFWLFLPVFLPFLSFLRAWPCSLPPPILGRPQTNFPIYLRNSRNFHQFIFPLISMSEIRRHCKYM